MFRDLKEYQEIQNLYENKVYLTEQDENELLDTIESFDLNDEELEYFVENSEEFYQDEEITLLEAPFKALKTLRTIRSAGKFGSGIKTNINLAKSAKRANISNILKNKGRKPFDPIKGKKFSGPVNFAKFTSIKDKIRKNIPKLALGAGAVGTVALASQMGKGKVEQEKKKIEDKVKGPTKVTPVTTGGGGKSSGNAGGSTDSGGTAGGSTTTDTTKTDTTKTDTTKTDTTKTPETKTDTTKTDTTKTDTTKTPETKKKKMHPIEKKNRARFGDERVDFLKKKNQDFQKMKKGGMTKDDFIKAYPKSITAQRAAGLRDHTEWDAYDLVLEYLHSSGQVATIEEANYVMTEMDGKTIQGIVEEQEKNLNEIVGAAVKGLKAVGKFGAKGMPQFAALAGTTAAIAPTVGKLAYKAKETVGNVVNTVTNFDPVGDARKKYQDKKAKEYEEKSGTTKKDGYFR